MSTRLQENINDCEPFIERLKVIQEKFELDIKNGGADREYSTTPNHHGLKTIQAILVLLDLKRLIYDFISGIYI